MHPTWRQLSWTSDWHVREECYEQALAGLTDAQHRQLLAAHWGSGTTSSSDAQFFRAGGQGEVSGLINLHYGQDPGVKFYTHLSDQFAPFYTKVIAATANEAPHVLDGLLYHQSSLVINEHYTDTGGFSDHVFAMCRLLGFLFAPRIRDLKARSLANRRKPLTLPRALSIVVDKPNPTQRDAMILKQADDHTADIQALQALLAHPDAGGQTRRIIDKEIRSIGLGARGENEAAYEINFHFGPSPNWVVIHDLRIETEHRVAQIDHLLINRLLDVWVCETKYLSGGLAINEFGECTTFLQGNRPQGIPSPFEQNRKHCALLQAIFDDGHFPQPRRLGIKLRPSLNNIVLIAKRARISRPKTKIDGVDCSQ